MKYIILGTYIDVVQNPEYQNIVNSNDPAANNYQGWLVDGLIRNGISIKNISFKTIIKEIDAPEQDNTRRAGYNESLMIKRKNIYKNHFQRIKHFSSQLSECLDKEDVIIVYSLSLPVLITTIRNAKKYNNKICVIIPDLPLHMSSNKSVIYRGLKHIDNFMTRWILKFCSHFVLLSEHIKSYIPEKHQHNYIIIEGAYNSNKTANANCEYTQSKPYILYSGTLNQRYGIRNLVEAFTSTSLDYNLVICGNGSTSEIKYIDDMANKDFRIKYIGSVDYQDVLYLQQSASLLINPRNNKGEFTRYSFPSKTMEYLASGTPTLLYRLDGIPNEYYDYCYSIDGQDDSIETLANKIVEVLSLKDRSIGNIAKEFIYTHKTGEAQAKKIIEYINK